MENYFVSIIIILICFVPGHSPEPEAPEHEAAEVEAEAARKYMILALQMVPTFSAMRQIMGF